VFRFKSKNEKSTFIKSTNFKSFDSEVPSLYNIAVEQEVIAADIAIALLILYLFALDVHQHRTFNRSRAETLFWGNDFLRSRPSTKRLGI